MAKGAAAVVVGMVAVGFVIALLWGLAEAMETRAFDRALRRVTAGMSRADVVRILGAPGSTASDENTLDAERKQDWLRGYPRPVRVKATALAFSAPDRQAYVYLDGHGRVETVIVAARGEGQRYRVLAGSSQANGSR